jgi:hypothetical protein
MAAVSLADIPHRPQARTDNGRIGGEIGCYPVDGFADDVLESVAVDFHALKAVAPQREPVMTKMIDALKAAIEAEKAKLLAELSQAAEPRLSAIRKEIEARESLLARFNRSRAA